MSRSRWRRVRIESFLNKKPPLEKLPYEAALREAVFFRITSLIPLPWLVSVPYFLPIKRTQYVLSYR